MNRQFSRVAGSNPGRSKFNLSHSRKFSAEMGLLYPVMCEETLPGDIWKVSYEMVARAAPLVAPILHRIDCKIHMFYEPTGLLMDGGRDEWTEFITGGEDGEDVTSLPTWSPSASAKRDKGTLWDFLHGAVGVTPDADSLPLDFGRRMYMDIFNEYYRDVAVEPKIDWSNAPGTDQDTDGVALPTGYNGDEDLQYVAWEKDYFTSSRPDQQLGSSSALPIVLSGDGTTPSFSNLSDANARGLGTYGRANSWERMGLLTEPSASDTARWENPGLEATSVDMHELRLSLAIQQWQERNMRAGVRYPEFLQAHWGNTGFSDSRLQRPEYIGGAQQPIVVSEVLYTAEGAADPVGQMAGHGISIKSNFIGKVRTPEYGYLMVLLSIRPKPTYHQGINRQWMRRTRYDFYTPEFAQLSEQAVLQRELYITSTKSLNETVFGYIPSWDEYRVRSDMVHGEFHDTFDHWHLCRQFGSAPTLSASFIRMHNVRDDAWAASSEPHFFVNFANIVDVIRPMPAMSTPGGM